MNADRLLALFDRVSEAPDAVPKMRRFVLDLAVRGKLVEQDPAEEPAKLPYDPVQIAQQLPLGWQAARFGDVIDLQYGKSLPPAERLEAGRVSVFGSNGVVAFANVATSETPAIIVGRKGSAGALNLCDGPSWTTDVAYYVAPAPWFEIRYLLSTLQSLDLGGLGKGVKPGLSRADVKPLIVFVPPLAEQRRIVARVDDLMALYDQLEAARVDREHRRDRLTVASFTRLAAPSPDAASFQEDGLFAIKNMASLSTRPTQFIQLREAILNLAVLGRLVRQSQNDQPAASLLPSGIAAGRSRGRPALMGHAGPSAPIAELPAGWTKTSLGQLSETVTSGSRGWAEFYSTEGAKFVRAQNIRFGRMRLNDVAFVNPPAKSEGQRTLIEKGDLCIVITGAGVTNPAVLDEDLGEAYVSQHVGLIKPFDRRLSRWMLLCMMAPAAGRAELLERAYGAGKPGLNLDNLRSLEIPLPPLAEQHRIVARVDELMALCDQLEAALKAADTANARLLDAILHEALNGSPRPEAA